MAVVALVIGFGAGYFFPHAAGPRGQLMAGGPNGGNGVYQIRGAGGKTLNGGNAVVGTVIAKDATSITLQLGGPNASSTNGGTSGTKIVLYGPSTQVGEFTTGSTNDIQVGQDVVITGSTNSDGSMTADSVQIRPAGSPVRGG